MRAGLELDLLQTLVAIVDSGSFAAAAQRIHRTQSAVSMQMRRLEAIAGKPIFDRDGRRACLTAEGETLLAYARRILSLQNEALAVLGEAERAGILRVGWPADFVAPILPAVLRRFADDYPNATILLRCEESDTLRDQVSAGELDIALVLRSPSWTEVEPIRREQLAWLAAAGFPREADPLPVAFARPGSVTRDLALHALGRSGRPHRIAHTSADPAGLLAIVRAGIAMTAMARSTVPEDLDLLGPPDGLPRLPDIELGMVKAPRGSKLAALFADCLSSSIEAGETGFDEAAGRRRLG